MNVNTGDVGENLIQLWASKTGIVVNPVRRDAGGWDLCLMFRRQSYEEKTTPVDLLPPELTCMVQVKTTASGAAREKIKLDNWKRMVDSPLPWFVAAIQLDADSGAESVHLVHIDQNWVNRAMERLAKTPPEKASNLHEFVMYVTWSDEHRLSTPLHTSLRDKIREHVGSASEYALRKLDWQKSAGYDERPNRIRFSLPKMQTHAARTLMSDFAIGLVDELPIAALRHEEVRFGIPRLVRETEDSKGSMQLPDIPSIGPSTITVSNAMRSESVTFQCSKTHLSSVVFPFLPKEYWKVRFIAPGMSFVLSPDNKKGIVTLTWRLTVKDVSPLDDLARTARLIRIYDNSRSEGICIEYAIEKTHRESTQPKGGGERIDAEVVALARTFEDAALLASLYGIDPSTVVQPGRFGQLGTSISLLLAAFQGKFLDLVETTVPTTNDLSGKKIAVLVCPFVVYGDRVLAAYVAIQGDSTWIPGTEGAGTVRIENGKALILSRWNVRGEDVRKIITDEKLDELQKKFMAEHNPDIVLSE